MVNHAVKMIDDALDIIMHDTCMLMHVLRFMLVTNDKDY